MVNSKQLNLEHRAFVLFLLALLSFCPSTWAHNKNLQDISLPVEIDDFKDCFGKVFAFGDSSTDTGNGFLLGIIKAFVKQFMAKNAPSFSDGGTLEGHRLSNGRLVVDFLCEALGKPTLRPYKELSANFSAGVNFAIAGSTALPVKFFLSADLKFNFSLTWQFTPQSYSTQIDWFNQHVDETECLGMNPNACRSHLGNALFWIGAFGRNDYARISKFDITSLISKRLTRLCVWHVKKVITAVLERGAKFIVVEGLPPTGCQSMELSICDPFHRDKFGCSMITNAWIRTHNDLLQKAIGLLRTKFSDATIVYADYYGAYQSILTNHQHFQLAEPFKACCGCGTGALHFDMFRPCGLPGTSTCRDPSKYINWDGIHLTETMNMHLARLLFHHGHCKPSFKELIAKKKAAKLAAHVLLHH